MGKRSTARAKRAAAVARQGRLSQPKQPAQDRKPSARPPMTIGIILLLLAVVAVFGWQIHRRAQVLPTAAAGHTAWRARSDKDRVPAFGKERLEAVDAVTTAKFDTHAEDVTAFLIDDRFGEPKARNLRADHAAGLGVLIEQDALIAKRREISGNGE